MNEADTGHKHVGNMERCMRSNLYRRNIGFLCSLQWAISRDSVSSLPGTLWGDGEGSRCVSRRMRNSVNSLPDDSGGGEREREKGGERGAGLHRVRRSASFLRETNPQGQYTAKSIYSGLTYHASFQKFKI